MKSGTLSMITLAVLVSASGCTRKEAPARKPAETTRPASTATDAGAAKAEPKSAARLLDEAIEARGGVQALKKASSWKSSWKGTSKGTTHAGTMIFHHGAVRRDFTTPDGKQVVSVRAADACWNRIGDNAGRCNPAEEKLCRRGIALNRAALLWPLEEEEGWSLEAGTLTIGETAYDTLTARTGEDPVRVTLVLDPEDHLIHRTVLHDATVGGRTGDIVAEVLERVEACGTVMTAKSKVLFDGTPIQVNQNTDIQCGPVDPAVFAFGP